MAYSAHEVVQLIKDDGEYQTKTVGQLLCMSESQLAELDAQDVSDLLDNATRGAPHYCTGWLLID